MKKVCLMLEGTYPYVSGGVSVCVHQLMQSLPQTHFTIFYIGARSDENLKLKYEIPANVESIHEFFLFDQDVRIKSSGRELSQNQAKALRILQYALHDMDETKVQDDRFFAALSDAIITLFPAGVADSDLLYSLTSRAVWKQLESEYNRLELAISFVDFFYTWQSSHLPIYRLLSYNFPRADLYHSMSTGYAGLAASAAAIKHKKHSIITEHGLYAHERAIEIFEADWLRQNEEVSFGRLMATDVLKMWWTSLFRNLSKISYGFASKVTTLYEGNQRFQLADGADSTRCSIIPNGINPRFTCIRRKNPSWDEQKYKNGDTFRVCFVGRVVEIKDVRTLIKAFNIVNTRYAGARLDIIGPTDEEPDYLKDCRELVSFLGLDKCIQFTGKRNVVEEYETVDCLVISSISEGQPLVILEAGLAGIPVVSTNVGACSELLFGREEADKLLGKSGLISEIGDSESLAENILKLIETPGLWEEMSKTAVHRVQAYYDEEHSIIEYDDLYHKCLSETSKVVELVQEKGDVWLGSDLD